MNLRTLPRHRHTTFARWGLSGRLRALIATAPPVEAPAPAGESPERTPPAERTPEDQTFPPPEGGVPFRIPVVMLEGLDTGEAPDVRYIEPGTVGRRDLPQTLMAMRRNPDGGFGHDGAIIAGRIDTMERYDASAALNRQTGQPYGPGVWAWEATGYLVQDTAEAASTLGYVRDRVLRGVSVDLAEATVDVEVLEEDEDGYPESVRYRMSDVSIGQATVCPMAAFPGAYIELADEEPLADEELPPIAASGQPGALTVPTPAAPVVASGGLAPVLPPVEWFERVEQLHPSRHVYIGRTPDGVPTGQTWGYVAEWGVPHAGILDREVFAPRLGAAGYRTFHSQGATMTAAGVEVPTGVVTFGGGHASLDYGVAPALAHYDNAGTAFADVVVGEDDFGVWFAGALRPSLSREQIETFAKHPLSGDWRGDPGDRNVRFVAALCVNTPGFTIGARAHIAASGARALVAAGSASLRVRAERAQAGGVDPAVVQAAVDRALAPVLASAGRAALSRLTRRG